MDTPKTIPPSVTAHAFNCPHCSVLTTQFWYDILGDAIDGNQRTPSIPKKNEREKIARAEDVKPEVKERLLQYLLNMESGQPFREHLQSSVYAYERIHNLFVSQCYACQRIALWVGEKLVYPPARTGPQPNADLPGNVLTDYDEARAIVNLSPRGAAALLRLCVQKLCIVLGEKGDDINKAIASLVSKGLNPLLQQSLDIVRVIGNEAVHPGVMDLKDDVDTANQLFELVNAITDQMISHPKRVSELYGKLPQSKREAIAARDAKATSKS